MLIDEYADRDGFHPADHEDDEADEPQPPEIRAVDQPSRAAGRPGLSGVMHGRTFLGVSIVILPPGVRHRNAIAATHPLVDHALSSEEA
jgi:hypothetical protein